jgi:hypothetical protein
VLWVQVAPVLKAAITAVAIDPSVTAATANFSARWNNQKQPFSDSKIKADILLSLNQGKLVDWGYTDTLNVSTNKLDRSLKAQREFVLHVQVRSYDQTEVNWAFEYAERIRTRLDRDDIYNTLLAANIVFIEDLGIVTADAVIDSRECSIANLDLRMRCAFDDATFPIDWIEEIQFSGAVSGGHDPINFPQVTIP